jgi:hypothetical protein
MKYITKDSGKRHESKSGMLRDTNEDKPRYDLIPIFALKRLAGLYARGAIKYGVGNWAKANTQEDLDRFKESMLRHMYQYLEGEVDEDHFSAVMFNLIGAEYVKEKLK